MAKVDNDELNARKSLLEQQQFYEEALEECGALTDDQARAEAARRAAERRELELRIQYGFERGEFLEGIEMFNRMIDALTMNSSDVHPLDAKFAKLYFDDPNLADLYSAEGDRRRALERIKKLVTKFSDPYLVDYVVSLGKEVLDEQVKEALEFCTPVLFGTAPTGALDACCRNAKDSNWKLVIVDEGIFGVCRALAPIMAIMVGEQCPAAELNYPLKFSNQITLSLVHLLSFYLVHGTTKTVTLQEVPDYALTLRDWLQQTMEIFILSHEVCHLALGHQMQSSIEGASLSQLHDYEFEADRYGFQVALHVSNKKGLSAFLVPLAAEFLLRFHSMAQQGMACFDEELANKKFKAHPTPEARILALREIAPKLLSAENMNYYLGTALEVEPLLNSINQNHLLIRKMTSDLRLSTKWRCC